jgi:adenylate cyclase
MGEAYSFSGDPEAALDLLKRAVRLNPYHPDWYLWFLGEAHFHLRQYDEAIRTLQRMRDQSEGHRLLAASYALSDRLEEARYHAQQVMSVYPDFTIEHWRTVPPDRNPEPLERFVEGLRMAGLK